MKDNGVKKCVIYESEVSETIKITWYSFERITLIPMFKSHISLDNILLPFDFSL